MGNTKSCMCKEANNLLTNEERNTIIDKCTKRKKNKETQTKEAFMNNVVLDYKNIVIIALIIVVLILLVYAFYYKCQMPKF